MSLTIVRGKQYIWLGRNKQHMSNNKIISLQQVEHVSQELHNQNKKIVLAGGCFDILHLGHLTFLEKAKGQGEILIVLLESDEAIKKTKGAERPIHSQEERAYMLTQLVPVDYVVLLHANMQNEEYDNIVKWIQPAIIAATEGDPGVSHKERQAGLVGADVVNVVKHLPNMSTSRIVHILSEEQ